MGIDESLIREIVRRLLDVTKPDRIILFGSAAAEIAVTCPENGVGKASVVTVCGLPSLIRPIAVSGTPNTAFTVRVSARVNPFVAGPTRVPTSTFLLSTKESNGARKSV